VQEEMVLSNLEMFRKRPHSLPWHLKITSGTISVSDTVAPSFSYTWPPVSREIIAAPSRNVQMLWNVVPVSDNAELTALTAFYKANSLDGPSVDQNIPPPTCQPNGSPKYFKDLFEEGAVPPIGAPFGEYNSTYIWVKNDPVALDCFDQIVKAALDSAPVSAQDRGLVVPAQVVSPGGRP
jgi:hypothetical protein